MPPDICATCWKIYLPKKAVCSVWTPSQKVAPSSSIQECSITREHTMILVPVYWLIMFCSCIGVSVTLVHTTSLAASTCLSNLSNLSGFCNHCANFTAFGEARLPESHARVCRFHSKHSVSELILIIWMQRAILKFGWSVVTENHKKFPITKSVTNPALCHLNVLVNAANCKLSQRT